MLGVAQHPRSLPVQTFSVRSGSVSLDGPSTAIWIRGSHNAAVPSEWSDRHAVAVRTLLIGSILGGLYNTFPSRSTAQSSRSVTSRWRTSVRVSGPTLSFARI